MDSRAQFDKWWSENMFIGGKCFADEQTKRRCLRAWQASRAAIEVKLPNEKPLKQNSYPEARAKDDDFNDAIEQCKEAMASVWISIKGQ